MLTVTFRRDPNDESTRVTIDIPRAVDALGGPAVDAYVRLIEAGSSADEALRAIVAPDA